MKQCFIFTFCHLFLSFLFDFDCSVLIDHATVGCSGRK
uniref:Pelovaterin n=1 Tax=Phage sp. ctv3H3 TaxID=2826753 RepID=A0A8S5NAJ5_9VIRU|nr:MAG TPA: Pelovaterin [Phage sp. ctv3H3]